MVLKPNKESSYENPYIQLHLHLYRIIYCDDCSYDKGEIPEKPRGYNKTVAEIIIDQF